jgi:hypothetical protein
VNPETQQLQQQLMMLQQQAQQAIGQLQTQLQQVQQDKTIDAKKLEIDAYNAETNRLKATTTGMLPEQVQAMVIQTLQQILASPPPDSQQPPTPQAPQGAFLLPADNQPNNGVMNG